MTLRFSALAAMLIAAMAAMPIVATAQEGAAPPAGQAQQPANVDDATLMRFAGTSEKLGALQEGLRQELESVKSEDEALELQKQTQEKMVNAVLNSGMSVEQYNQLVAAIRSNPELQRRLEKFLADR